MATWRPSATLTGHGARPLPRTRRVRLVGVGGPPHRLGPRVGRHLPLTWSCGSASGPAPTSPTSGQGLAASPPPSPSGWGPGGQVTLIDGDERLLDVARVPAARSRRANRPRRPRGPAARRSARRPLRRRPRRGTRSTTPTTSNTRSTTSPERSAPAVASCSPRAASPRVFLPREHGLGEPDLEARLDAATARWFWSPASAPPRRPSPCPTARVSPSPPPAWPTCARDRSWSTSRRRSAPTSAPSSRTC